MMMNMEKAGAWQVHEDETVIVDPEGRKLQEQAQRHNWKASSVAALTIVLIFLAVGLAVLFLPSDEDDTAFWHRVTYDLHSVLDTETSMFVNNSLSSHQWKSTYWISDHQLIYWDASGGLSLYRPLSSQSVALVPASVVLQFGAEKYWPSFDGRYILFRQRPDEDCTSPYRGPGEPDALYAVYDTLENDLWKLRLRADDLTPTRLKFAAFSGRSSYLLAIDVNHRIYWTTDATSRVDWQLRGGFESASESAPNSYTVGLPDFTYSGGITRWKNLVWPSADGNWLLYATLNSSRCHRLDFVDHLADHSETNSIRYAVPDGHLPEIKLKLVNLERNAARTLSVGQLANQREWLLTTVKWLDEDSFVLVWMSRNQNLTSVFHCQVPGSVDCVEIIREDSPVNRWMKPPVLFPTANGAFIFAWHQTDIYGGQRQKVSHHRPPWHKRVSLQLPEDLTVLRFLSWNESNQTIYLLATRKNEPQQSHLYRVIKTGETECMTCERTAAGNCNFVDANFELLDGDFFELQCLGPYIPSVHISHVSDREMTATLREVGQHDHRRDLLEHLTPNIRYMRVPLADGSSGHVQLLLPKVWHNKQHHRLRFPLVIQTLDWDQEETMTDVWRNDWASYSAVSRQIIYARVRGRESADNAYGSLRWGAEDILTMAKFIVTELRHVDSKAVVIIGRGVGGYLAAHAMAKDELNKIQCASSASAEWESCENLIRCGVALSPVGDWYRVETTVAERYLGNLKEQQEHYVMTRLEGSLRHIRNDTLLVIDSVPFNPLYQYQQMAFAKQLINAGTRFQFMVYPRSGEVGDGKMLQYHAHLTLEHFIEQCLNSAD